MICSITADDNAEEVKMKLKSYLRGLGLGIIVTTIILVIAFKARGREMTDIEIISRAQQLGMVETSLFDSSDKEEMGTAGQQIQTESSGEGMTEPESTNEPETPSETASVESEPSTQEETTTVKETESVTEETTTEQITTQETTTASEIVTILFENITSADKASKLLLEAGIIQNVEEFNQYLSDNGYARRIGEGTFEFRRGMSFEEIAKIITRQK